MVKNDRIIRIDDDIIGLILEEGKLLVIENDTVVSMGKTPKDIYPIHPNELHRLPWQSKLIINAVMISQELDSPFLTEMSGSFTRN